MNDLLVAVLTVLVVFIVLYLFGFDPLGVGKLFESKPAVAVVPASAPPAVAAK